MLVLKDLQFKSTQGLENAELTVLQEN